MSHRLDPVAASHEYVMPHGGANEAHYRVRIFTQKNNRRGE